MSKLVNKVAVITGGNSGIGLATAKRFVEEGAFVYITGRRQKELDTAVAQIGSNVTGVQSDLSNLNDLDRLYTQVASEKGRVDILFANAGIGNHIAPIGNITDEQFSQTVNVNMRGTLFSVQKVLPLMPNGGSIVISGSTASTMGIEGFSVYGGTKVALRSFARTWAVELKHRHIRVNVLTIGPTDTPIFETAGFTAEQILQMKAALAGTIPLGRLAAPEETAKAAVFLASDDSSYMTCAELSIDGGQAQI